MVTTDNDSKSPIPNGNSSGVAQSNAGHNTTDSTKNEGSNH